MVCSSQSLHPKQPLMTDFLPMTSQQFSAFLVAASAALFAGCSSTPLPPAATAPAPAPAAAPTPAAPVVAAKPTAAPASMALPAHLDPASVIFQKRSVYFGFDQFSIAPEFSSLVEAHGKYLAGNAALAIKIEGHADERGSREYNLALGQKRAEAVVKAMKAFGAKDGQLEATSFGEDKPQTAGHDEAAWAKNRRADLAYPKK